MSYQDESCTIQPLSFTVLSLTQHGHGAGAGEGNGTSCLDEYNTVCT